MNTVIECLILGGVGLLILGLVIGLFSLIFEGLLPDAVCGFLHAMGTRSCLAGLIIILIGLLSIIAAMLVTYLKLS